jgi:DNA-binding response OmpR family regulator
VFVERVGGGTKRRVLLADDDLSLRRLIATTLGTTDFELLQATDGEEALEIARTRTTPIHLLLADVVMPRLSGREVADRLRIVRPETRVLFTSGYTDDAVLRHHVSRAQVLEKPFDAETMLRRVREALDH